LLVPFYRFTFDSWAWRNMAGIAGDADLPAYDRWLMQYAQSWIDLLESRSWPEEIKRPLVHELSTALQTGIAHWKSEARKHLRSQAQHSDLAEQEFAAARPLPNSPAPAPSQVSSDSGGGLQAASVAGNGRIDDRAFDADSALREQLTAYWLRLRADEDLWKRGMQDEKGSGLAFPPRLVAYDLVPLFRDWALRAAAASTNAQELLPRLIGAICPDDQYIEWTESDRAAADRAERYDVSDGRLSRREGVEPLVFGLWETAVQQAWAVAKNRMGKYEACASCREYDAHEALSPATSALRLLGDGQPVQEDLRRQISAALSEHAKKLLPQVTGLQREHESERGVDESPRVAPKELIDRYKRQPPRRSYEKLASKIGIGKDTIYAITGETRWVSDETYELVAGVCGCKPEDLHPRDLPRPERRRRS
jgi:hypothetical protein